MKTAAFVIRGGKNVLTLWRWRSWILGGRCRVSLKVGSNMMNTFKALTLAATLVAGTALSASAATVTSVFATNATLNAAKATSLSMPGGATWSTPVTTETGTLANAYKSPFADNTTAFYAVGTGLPGATVSPVTLSFASSRNSFGFLWGSPDSYNSLEFYDGATLVATVVGADLVPPPKSQAYFVTVSGLSFDSVKFIDNLGTKTSTDEAAFEFANISSVPVPAAGFLMLTAFGGFAALRRRKQA